MRRISTVAAESVTYRYWPWTDYLDFHQPSDTSEDRLNTTAVSDTAALVDDPLEQLDKGAVEPVATPLLAMTAPDMQLDDREITRSQMLLLSPCNHATDAAGSRIILNEHPHEARSREFSPIVSVELHRLDKSNIRPRKRMLDSFRRLKLKYTHHQRISNSFAPSNHWVQMIEDPEGLIMEQEEKVIMQQSSQQRNHSWGSQHSIDSMEIYAQLPSPISTLNSTQSDDEQPLINDISAELAVNEHIQQQLHLVPEFTHLERETQVPSNGMGMSPEILPPNYHNHSRQSSSGEHDSVYMHFPINSTETVPEISSPQPTLDPCRWIDEGQSGLFVTDSQSRFLYHQQLQRTPEYQHDRMHTQLPVNSIETVPEALSTQPTAIPHQQFGEQEAALRVSTEQLLRHYQHQLETDRQHQPDSPRLQAGENAVGFLREAFSPQSIPFSSQRLCEHQSGVGDLAEQALHHDQQQRLQYQPPHLQQTWPERAEFKFLVTLSIEPILSMFRETSRPFTRTSE